ncbi:Ldh family oxidoreductase [Candidatus Entotheonella palauensis]|uniref:Ldh family oxidoreductase n=1 Tax=Candidatus Entotheonella palauensis TaxID=93172 RepID=UPI000B7F6EEB|nr:Ldh family oxidoreductase [Candidatus Entotheonella palauensis]
MVELARLTLEEVDALAFSVLRASGLSEDHARAIADTVTAAERDDSKSHGLFRIPGYVASVRSGKVTPDAVPEVRELAPAVVQVDGHNGFAPLALRVGREPLAAKAREHGIAALGVTNIYHFAALWPEVTALAEMGLVALAFTSASSFVAPHGGIKPLYGTNPMAFAWPREGRPSLVFDQSSSASARGEIQIHQRDGKPIPEGWAIDAEGNPTTDPTAALEGAQLSFGGHKGAAIALMIELLAGALIGDVFSFEASAMDNRDGGPAIGGELMIAIDPARCIAHGNRQAQLAHAETLFAKILEQDGTRLPSDRRYRARLRTPSEGITIPTALYNELKHLQQSSDTAS